MANPTTNYGWVLPTSTDLVTDLPADFDVALQGVDTRMKALEPATTLGDLQYRSATANTNTRLPIGTTGQVLAVSGGVPAWTTVGGSALTKIVGRSSFSNVTNTGTTFDSCFSTTYSNYVIVIDQAAAVTGNDTLRWQFRSGGSTISAGYYSGYTNITWNGTTTANSGGTNASSLSLGTLAAGANTGSLTVNFYDPNANNNNNKLAYTGYSPQLQGGVFGAGHCDNAANVDGFILSCSTGNIYTANVTVYGLAI
jgi:hypothetical protein